jgi:hypothetical protein
MAKIIKNVNTSKHNLNDGGRNTKKDDLDQK